MLPRILKNFFKSKNTVKKKVLVFLTVFLFFSVVLSIVFTSIVSAQTTIATPDQTTQVSFGLAPAKAIGLGGDDIRLIIARVIRAVLGLLGLIALVIVLYAGYTIMTSEGNEEKVTQGKRILTNAVIGLIIILSALAIVQFVIRALTGGLGGDGGNGKGRPPELFYGSGALGRIVKDHYPFRGQTGVKRNTKVVVTFAEPIDPSTIIENSNRTCWDDAFFGPTTTCKTKDNPAQPVTSVTLLNNIANPYYGDCVIDDNFNWDSSCDHLKNNAVQIHTQVSSTEFVKAAAMTVYQDGNKLNAYTFVFKPIEPQYLGSATENVWYVVRLTNEIKKKNLVNNQVVGAFDGQFAKYYQWKFETDTNLDFDPPYVVDTYPGNEEAIARNTIAQINFNEPVDPTVTQGMVGPSSSFNHVIFNTTTITGEWKITNGYQTIEFVSNQPCGLNSCGQPMYCFPVDCPDPKDKGCSTDYSALIRTAELFTTSSFESFPFSGVADISGNALDNGVNNKPDSKVANPHKPGNGNPAHPKQIAEVEKAPDNYAWPFKVQNEIDRTPPYLQQMEPGVDKEEVQGDEALRFYFSKRMWLATLNDLYLDEFPVNFCYGPNHPEDCLDDIFFVPRTKNQDQRSITTLLHREFGPNDTDLYYFPIIPSTVKSLNFNCLYPGRGPVSNSKNSFPVCEYQFDDLGNVTGDNGNCINVRINDNDKDTGCVQTTIPTDEYRLKPDVSACTSTMYGLSQF